MGQEAKITRAEALDALGAGPLEILPSAPADVKAAFGALLRSGEAEIVGQAVGFGADVFGVCPCMLRLAKRAKVTLGGVGDVEVGTLTKPQYTMLWRARHGGINRADANHRPTAKILAKRGLIAFVPSEGHYAFVITPAGQQAVRDEARKSYALGGLQADTDDATDAWEDRQEEMGGSWKDTLIEVHRGGKSLGRYSADYLYNQMRSRLHTKGIRAALDAPAGTPVRAGAYTFTNVYGRGNASPVGGTDSDTADQTDTHHNSPINGEDAWTGLIYNKVGEPVASVVVSNGRYHLKIKATNGFSESAGKGDRWTALASFAQTVADAQGFFLQGAPQPFPALSSAFGADAEVKFPYPVRWGPRSEKAHRDPWSGEIDGTAVGSFDPGNGGACGYVGADECCGDEPEIDLGRVYGGIDADTDDSTDEWEDRFEEMGGKHGDSRVPWKAEWTVRSTTGDWAKVNYLGTQMMASAGPMGDTWETAKALRRALREPGTVEIHLPRQSPLRIVRYGNHSYEGRWMPIYGSHGSVIAWTNKPKAGARALETAGFHLLK